MTFAIQQWKIQSVVNLRGCNPDIFYFTPAFTSNNNNLHEGMPATVDEFLRSGLFIATREFGYTNQYRNSYSQN